MVRGLRRLLRRRRAHRGVEPGTDAAHRASILLPSSAASESQPTPIVGIPPIPPGPADIRTLDGRRIDRAPPPLRRTRPGHPTARPDRVTQVGAPGPLPALSTRRAPKRIAETIGVETDGLVRAEVGERCRPDARGRTVTDGAVPPAFGFSPVALDSRHAAPSRVLRMGRRRAYAWTEAGRRLAPEPLRCRRCPPGSRSFRSHR